MRFRRILWTKNVALGDGELAYGGQDASIKAREPKKPGDHFELHSTPEDAESLSEPKVGDLIVLTQHGQATHLIEVIGATIETRSRRTMRKGSRDTRFPYQRTCALVVMHDFGTAPFVEEAFGFNPRNEGGEVFLLSQLPAFEASNFPLWAVQKRLEQQLDGAITIRDLFLSRNKGPSPAELITQELEAELLGRSPMVAKHIDTTTEETILRKRPALRSSHRRWFPRKSGR